MNALMCVWSSKDNFQEVVFPSTMWVCRMELGVRHGGKPFTGFV